MQVQTFTANSGVRISRWRSVLVLSLVLVLGLSFAVPAEDIPETAYDESETLPYESAPLFSLVQESVRAPESVLTRAFPLAFRPTARGDKTLAEQSGRKPHAIRVSVTILNHSFRC